MLNKMRNNLKRYKAKDFFLIYQMGKVGSSAIENSLSNSVNIHTLYNNHPCPYNHSIGYLGLYKWFSERLFCRIKKLIFSLRKETKVICIYRDPFDRNLSMFMQDFCFWYSRSMQNGHINGKVEDKALPLKLFKEQFNHNYPFEWFDKELYRLTGVDVFTHASRLRENGYFIEKNGKFNVLCISYPELHSVLERSAVVDFIGVKVKLGNRNSAKDKWYSDIYIDLKESKEEILFDVYDEFCNEKLYKIL